MNAISLNSPVFVKINHALDYIPVVSTGKGLALLIQKIIGAPTPKTKGLDYYWFIEEKSISRDLARIVPVIGNIFLGIFDIFAHVRSTQYLARGKVLLREIPSKRDSLVSPNQLQANELYQELRTAACYGNVDAILDLAEIEIALGTAEHFKNAFMWIDEAKKHKSEREDEVLKNSSKPLSNL